MTGIKADIGKNYQPFERLYYSAVVLWDERVSSFDTINQALHCITNDELYNEEYPKDWSIRRMQCPVSRNYYPTRLRESSQIRTDSGYRYFVYCSMMKTLENSSSATIPVMIASPYRDLLGRELDLIDKYLIETHGEGSAKASYAEIDMEKAFDYFGGAYPEAVSAIRITLQVLGDVGVQTASLSGDKPLRSRLRGILRKISDPYGLRLSVKESAASRTGTVDIVRHGVISWYFSNENSIERVMSILDFMYKHNWLQHTSERPWLGTKPPEDQDQQEHLKERSEYIYSLLSNGSDSTILD